MMFLSVPIKQIQTNKVNLLKPPQRYLTNWHGILSQLENTLHSPRDWTYKVLTVMFFCKFSSRSDDMVCNSFSHDLNNASD